MNIKTTHAIQDGNCSKTFTGSGTKRTWCEPLEEVSTGMPGRQASRTFNVPQNTLGGSPEDENAPVQYCVYCAHHGWTLWCSTVCVVHIMGERSGAVLCVLCTSWAVLVMWWGGIRSPDPDSAELSMRIPDIIDLQRAIFRGTSTWIPCGGAGKAVILDGETSQTSLHLKSHQVTLSTNGFDQHAFWPLCQVALGMTLV